MYVGAALSTVGIALSALDVRSPTVLLAGTFLAVVHVILYVLLAFQVRLGRNWARLVAIVWSAYLVVSTIAALSVLAVPPASFTAVLVARAVTGVAVAVLLLRPDSTAFSTTRP